MTEAEGVLIELAGYRRIGKVSAVHVATDRMRELTMVNVRLFEPVDLPLSGPFDLIIGSTPVKTMTAIGGQKVLRILLPADYPCDAIEEGNLVWHRT